MLQINVTRQWRDKFHDGHVGMLLVDSVDNSRQSPVLDEKKNALEQKLCKKFNGFSRTDYMEIGVLNQYRNYYKRFKKTYHVQLQIESIVRKNKSFPNVSPLVDANFMAEMETHILTAGHDADLLAEPIMIDATKGDEVFTQMSGATQSLKPDDMMMSDARGVVCSIIYGQDNRTPISSNTRRALFVAYAPPGVTKNRVQYQLDTILENIRLFAPDVLVEMIKVYSAD